MNPQREGIAGRGRPPRSPMLSDLAKRSCAIRRIAKRDLPPRSQPLEDLLPASNRMASELINSAT